MKDNVVKTEYGYEVTWASTDSYTGKILVFESIGAALPLHFHKNKNKSWFVNAGKFRVQWVDTLDGKYYAKERPEGSTFHVPALMPVSLESLAANSAMAEVSDQHLDSDVYRLN
jgi:uncharacterized RmlC-like cupin family protein